MDGDAENGFGDQALNYESNEVQGTWIQCYDEESGYPYIYNDVTGETKWIDPSESNDLVVTLWQKFYDDNGDEFYYNPHTGESSWELPTNAVLEETPESLQTGNEDLQFGEPDEENIEYDGDKYIDMYSSTNEPNRRSIGDGSGVDNNIFDGSLENDDNNERLNQLAQASVHSGRSTKSSSFIPMKLLVRKTSNNSVLSEKKTSFGNLNMLEKKHSAQSLGIKNGASFVLNRTPVVRDSLKPSTPQPQTHSRRVSGFARMKVGASVLRKQIDDTGVAWVEYQAADNGPIFYAPADVPSAGQWNRPHIFDLEELSSTSVISVEPVDFNSLDEALISRPSSRKDLIGAITQENSTSSGKIVLPTSKSEQTASKKWVPKQATTTATISTTSAIAASKSEPITEERKSLFGSFINSVFDDVVSKEKTVSVNTKPAQASAALDALFGDEDVKYIEEDEEPAATAATAASSSIGGGSSKNITGPTVSIQAEDNKNIFPVIDTDITTSSATSRSMQMEGGLDEQNDGPYSPDFNPVITTQLNKNGVPSQIASIINSEVLLSPVERINLTPKSKLPPGSGMRKSSFSQLHYIPEAQSLFDDAADSSGISVEHNRDRADSVASSVVDPATTTTAAAVIGSAPFVDPIAIAAAAQFVPEATTAGPAVAEVPAASVKQQVGEGLAAARNMYATTAATAPAPSSSTANASTTVIAAESSPTTCSMPFNSPEPQPQVSIATPGDLPKADLFGSETPTEHPSVHAPSSSSVPETDRGLGNWIQCYDDESGWPYVYNEQTGEVKWVEPESTEQLLAVLWEVCYDQDGNQFYYNQETGESSWELPENAKLSNTVPLEAPLMAATTDGDSTPGLESPVRVATNTTSSSGTNEVLLLSDSNTAAAVMSPSLVSMKSLTKNASLLSMIEKKTSVGNLTPLAKKASAADLGIRSGSAWIKSKPPEIKDDLKPTVGTPKKTSSSLSGFALLKIGAKVLDKQIDEDGRVWIMYQAVDKGPIFYAEEDAESAGQWKKPAIYQDGAEEVKVDDQMGSTEEVQEVDDQMSRAETVQEVDDQKVPVEEQKELELESRKEKITALSVLDPAAEVLEIPGVPPTEESVNAAIEASAGTVPVSDPAVVVPPLSLQPIVAQQPAVASSVNALPSVDALDPSLYELSGMTADSPNPKGSSGSAASPVQPTAAAEEEPGEGVGFSASRHSLLQELRAMGLDEDGNLLPEPNIVPNNCASDTLHPSIPDATNKETKHLLSLEEKKRANIDKKLQELSSPVQPALIQSPYRAKTTEKYPIKVKNNFTATAATISLSAHHPSLENEKAPDQLHPVSPSKTEYSVPKKSNSPHKVNRNKNHGLTAKEIYSGGTIQKSQDTDLCPPVLSHSIQDAGISVPFSAYGSPVALGGAVRSSFLTDLGLSSLEPPTGNPVAVHAATESVYAPPADVPMHVLEEQLQRNTKIDTSLHKMATNDVNEDEASILLQRLENISSYNLSTVATLGKSKYNTSVNTSPIDHEYNIQKTCKHIIGRCCILIEKIRSISTEQRTNESQLLEMMLEQRQHLSAPRSVIRDYKAYNSLPMHCCSPQAVKFQQIQHKLAVVLDTGVWLLCKDPFFLHGKYYYVHKNTKNIQISEPFDFYCKRVRASLCQESWSDYNLNVHAKQQYLENTQVELLRDGHGGLLLYSVREDQYSSTGRFDANPLAQARLGGTSQLSTVGTLNARTAAALLHTSDPTQYYTHAHTPTAKPPTAVFRSTACGTAALANLQHNTTTIALPAEYTRTQRNKSPQNVWASFDFPKNIPQNLLPPTAENMKNSTSFLRNTVPSKFTTEFNSTYPDQTAVSIDNQYHTTTTAGEEGEDMHFRTLKHAFSAFGTTEEALLGGDLHAYTNNNTTINTTLNTTATSTGGGGFTLPYYDTTAEILLERLTHSPSKQVDSGEMLLFEKAMSPAVYQLYSTKLLQYSTEPDNPVPLLELMEILLYEGHGKQAIAVLKRAMQVIEVQAEWSFTSYENIILRLLYMKLNTKYYSYYEKPEVVHALIESFPESPVILTHSAIYFHELKYYEQSELLFTAALVLNPNYDLALLNYSRLLILKSADYRSALRYLARISEESDLWLPAKLEIANLHAFQHTNTASALIVAYKNCTYLSVENQEDSLYSVALHCMAYHHHRLQEEDKADFFMKKAIAKDPNNSIAMLLSAAISAKQLHSSTTSNNMSMNNNDRPRTANNTSNNTTINANTERPRTATNTATTNPHLGQTGNMKSPLSKEEIDSRYRSGMLLAPKYRYRWVALLGYADYVCSVMLDIHRAEQYYSESSKLSFSYSVWSTLAYIHFYQYIRGDTGVAGRLLLRTLRHRHNDVVIDCLTDFNAFRHQEDTAAAAGTESNVFKYMSIPAQQQETSKFIEITDDLEISALYVVIAYYLIDVQEWEEAMKYAAAAIRINETYSPALRCIALITWQHHNTRKQSLRYFSTALEFGLNNPYVLRTCGIIKAMEGNHQEAMNLLETSIKITPAYALAYRALAMMYYIYRNNYIYALELLTKSFHLSHEEDIECLRLKAQILMDQKKFKEAKILLQQALYIVPWDIVSLSSLAYCISNILTIKGKQYIKETKEEITPINYNSRFMSLRSYEDLIHSRDPEELFEASVTLDLQRILKGHMNTITLSGVEQYNKAKIKRSVNPFSQSNGMILSNFAVEHEVEEIDADYGNNMIGYAYYWYGMYELSKKPHINYEKCRLLFTLASKISMPGATSSCTALAFYRLGELAEHQSDLVISEQYYQNSLQCEPMEPISILRLFSLAEAGLKGTKRLIQLLERSNTSKQKKSKKTLKKKKLSQHTGLDSSGTLSTYHPPLTSNSNNTTALKQKGTSALVHNLTELLNKPLLTVSEGVHASGSEDFMEDNNAYQPGGQLAEAFEEYERRLLLHQRVYEGAVLKKRSYRKSVGDCAPSISHHVFVDSYWLERLLHAFSGCEDWAVLLKSTAHTHTQRTQKKGK